MKKIGLKNKNVQVKKLLSAQARVFSFQPEIKKNEIINDALKVTPIFTAIHEENLYMHVLNFRHHFLFGVPFKITSF
jgi:hypothetical protein